jgi:hypothetical protein
MLSCTCPYLLITQLHTGAQHGGSDAALQGKSDAEEAALKRVLSRVANKGASSSVC